MLGAGEDIEVLGPLFYLLLQGCYFLGCLGPCCCCAKDLLEVPIELITPSYKSLSLSQIRESHNV
jgi:hypothetical protein